jgi:flagellar biogenesis protein FliO
MKNYFIEIIAILVIDAKKKLFIIRVLDEYYLTSCSDSSIQLLHKLSKEKVEAYQKQRNERCFTLKNIIKKFIVKMLP